MTAFHQHARTSAISAAAMAAAGRYRSMDLEARIAVADPHELVSMLFAGLREALGRAERATRGTLRTQATGRALAIIEALDTSLDFSAGGSVARALSAVYAQLRILVVAGNSEMRAELFAAADLKVAVIHASWGAIGHVGRA